MRKKIVAGNWKMNTDLTDAKILASEVVNMVRDEVISDVAVVLAPPFPFISSVKALVNVPKVYLAAQNCNDHENGAYTGEVSAPMLKSLGCSYVIIGHSERREYFSETNTMLKNKVDVVLKHGLIPIFCCGEPLQIRENGTYIEYVCKQITESLFHLDSNIISTLVIAYEPIWAIGTGKTATSAQAQEMHSAIRKHIEKKYGNTAQNVSILYGGSCKPDNAKELFACADVDGGLIGGASLKSRDFIQIVKSF